MKKKILIFLLVAVLGGFFGTLITDAPGYVLVVWGERSIETTLWVAIGLILFIYFTLTLVVFGLVRFFYFLRGALVKSESSNGARNEIVKN
tara:strand:- start:2446 stop:2718 length:273 start_codon:yes stop_codon:yes gene_type:complete